MDGCIIVDALLVTTGKPWGKGGAVHWGTEFNFSIVTIHHCIMTQDIFKILLLAIHKYHSVCFFMQQWPLKHCFLPNRNPQSKFQGYQPQHFAFSPKMPCTHLNWWLAAMVFWFMPTKFNVLHFSYRFYIAVYILWVRDIGVY